MDLLIRSLRQYRTRFLESFFTVVAIALAVAVITVVAAFLDTSHQLSRDFERSLASREIYMSVGPVPFPVDVDVVKVFRPEEGVPPLTLADLEPIKEAVPALDFAYHRSGAILAMADWHREQGIDAIGITEEYLDAAKLDLEAGSLFLSEDFREGNSVILLSREAVDRLGLDGDPIGQEIVFDHLSPRINASPVAFTIVGVFEAPTAKALFPYQSNPLTMPGHTVPWQVDYLTFAVEDRAKLELALSQLRTYADNRFGEGRVTVEPVQNPVRLLPQQHLTSLIIAIFASIGVTAASFNIMNLAVAKVMRRAHDIGIQRSLGATRACIRSLLLMESLALSFVGGCFGVLLGLGMLSWYDGLLSSLDRLTALRVGFRVEPSVDAVLAGLISAVVTSLSFSLYPSVQASRIGIVEAIREGQGDASLSGLPFLVPKNISLRKALASIQLVLGALVVMIALSSYVTSLSHAGSDRFSLTSGAIIDEEWRTTRRFRRLFRERDLAELMKLTPAIERLAAYDLAQVQEIVHIDERFAIRNAVRAGSTYFEVADIELVEGSFFTERDAERQAPVMVMSEDAARSIFGSESAIGQEVIVPAFALGTFQRPSQTLQVIGTYRPLTRRVGASWPVSYMSPSMIFPSWITGGALGAMGEGGVFSTLMAVSRPGQGEAAREQLLTAVRQYYREVPELRSVASGEDFYIAELVDTEVFDPNATILGLFTIITLAISAIGIFTVTVLSVTQRSRAIGMKRALGASRRQLTLAFVKGAASTALVAGTLGVALAALLIPWLKEQAGTAFIGTLELRFEPWLGIVVVLLVVLVNAGLGLVPARQISRGQPAEALREG
jgi:putative ABC transport system permease protein